ncbi:nucleolar complex protein 2 [[Candida] anglica]
MAKPAKSTKKFQNKHLKHTIEHRREVQKNAKKYASRKRSKGKTEDGDEATTGAATTKASKEVFNDMSVDDLFAGGFEVPKEKKFKKTEESDDEGSSSEDEDAMKEDMKNLADKDPEFYKYLQDNDKDLLDFEGVNPLDAISDDESEEEAEGEKSADEEKKDKKKTKAAAAESTGTKKVEITSALVKQWDTQLTNKPTVKVIKNIAIAFKAAVNIQNAQDEDYKYAVTDPKAFNALMLLTLQKLPEAIQKLVKYKVHAGTGARTVPQKNQSVKPISAILKSVAGAYITLLQDITNTETAALVLVSLQEIFPYYLSYRRLLKEILGAIVRIWASTNDVQTQIATFAFLNNASREFPRSILETVLKSVYSTFLQNCRHTNVHTMSMLNFCKNSAAELFGIDETVSYQVGFEYVRQLAIHLRNSINATSNAKEGYKTIYNWQYCHSLDFWSRVLAQQCTPEKEAETKKESPLRQLIYPLVQVTLGAIRLIPTAQFFPLRFYLIKSLTRLQNGTGVFIPIFPLLAEILTSTAITKPPKKATLEAVDFEHNIKVNQAYLGTKTYQDGLCEQFIELASEFFVLYTKNIAFPELATPAILSLRRFTKKSKNVRFNKQLQQLVEKLTSNSEFITVKRSNVEYGPSNKHEVQAFLNDVAWDKTPLGQYVVVQRQAKEEKLRILQEALEEDKARAEQEKEQAEESDVDMEDLNEGEESSDEE